MREHASSRRAWCRGHRRSTSSGCRAWASRPTAAARCSMPMRSALKSSTNACCTTAIRWARSTSRPRRCWRIWRARVRVSTAAEPPARGRGGSVDFEFSRRSREYGGRLAAFMDEHIYPNEERFYAQLQEGDHWEEPALLEELKAKARAAGLWNLFLPDSRHGAGLSNLDYAPLCEMMGRVRWSPEVFNCSAPDTGNMETLERYGTPEQKKRWLEPLLAGEIRSAFAMTEPRVASSDATNIETRIVRDGDEYVINGRKWWSSGVGDPRCKIA